jgi:hypothetical protein
MFQVLVDLCKRIAVTQFLVRTHRQVISSIVVQCYFPASQLSTLAGSTLNTL